LQPTGRRFTQRGVRSSTTKHTFGQWRPGKRNARGMRLASDVWSSTWMPA